MFIFKFFLQVVFLFPQFSVFLLVLLAFHSMKLNKSINVCEFPDLIIHGMKTEKHLIQFGSILYKM
jgi:hypothetical protein